LPFTGFTEEDFSVFELPGFEARMPVLKANITPKLKELGAELLPALQREVSPNLHVHVAQHLRRSVNAPEETWVAFSRDKRGYKPYTHFRVAINSLGVKIVCYMEEYAVDKPTFAENLRRNARAIADYLKQHPEIRSHDHEANYGKLMEGRQLSEEDAAQLAGRLTKVKSQHANFAIKFTGNHPLVKSPKFAGTALEAIKDLLPLYLLGAEPGYRMTAE
jgi:uncharacterized protein YktB (UPF0637 family)